MLGGNIAHFDGKDHYRLNGGSLNNRGVGVVKVEAFNLLVSTDAKSSFELFGCGIGIAFDFPSRREDLHVQLAWDEGPAFEDIL